MGAQLAVNQWPTGTGGSIPSTPTRTTAQALPRKNCLCWMWMGLALSSSEAQFML